MPPIGLRMNTFFQRTSGNRGNFGALVPAGTVPPFIPKTDFSTGLFSIFTAGNFGSDIAFWVDSDFNVGGDNTAGGLGDGYLKFVNIGHLLKMKKDALSLRVGRFELDLPFSQARNINIQELHARREPVTRGPERNGSHTGQTVEAIFAGVDHVPPHDGHQPRVGEVISLHKAAGEPPVR
jgi:hypothetical protein